jgi:hypothetical protein
MAGVAVAALLLVASAAPRATAQVPELGSHSDQDLHQRAQRAMQRMTDIVGLGDQRSILHETAALLRNLDQAAPCSEEGARYKAAAMAFVENQAAAAACRAIVEANPTLAGVNAMLTCLAPVNSMLVTSQRAMAELGFTVLTSECTLTASGPVVLDIHRMPLLQYALTIQLASGLARPIADLRKFGSMGRQVYRVGPEGWLELDSTARFVYHNPADERALFKVLARDGSLLPSVVNLSPLFDKARTEAINVVEQKLSLPSQTSNLVGWYGKAMEHFVFGKGAVVTRTGPLRDDAVIPAALETSEGPVAGQAVVLPPGGTLLAVADPAAVVGAGYVPSWVEQFAGAYERVRLAQAQALRGLVGLTPDFGPDPPADVPPGVRLVPEPGSLGEDLAGALNAVLAHHELIAERLETLRRLLVAGGAPEADDIAKEVSRLLKREPKLRRKAVALLTPRRGDPIQAIILAPYYLDVDLKSVLVEPELDEAQKEAGKLFAQIARALKAAVP